jgi:hypothetical protein
MTFLQSDQLFQLLYSKLLSQADEMTVHVQVCLPTPWNNFRTVKETFPRLVSMWPIFRGIGIFSTTVQVSGGRCPNPNAFSAQPHTYSLSFIPRSSMLSLPFMFATHICVILSALWNKIQGCIIWNVNQTSYILFPDTIHTIFTIF